MFNPAVAENLKVFAEMKNTPEAIYAMPVSMNQGVLIYNKEVFDKFDVPYPEEGMTWNEVIALGEKVTGNKDGIDYIGLDATGARVLTRPKGLSSVDENGEININTDPGYKEIFEMLNGLYNIPGIVDHSGELYTYGMDFFMKERRLAMFPYWLINVNSRIPIMEETGIEWDITTFPSFEDAPGLGREVDYHVLAVPETAENRDAALRLLEEVVSDEVQTYLSEDVARLTVLDNDEIRNTYAASSGAFEEKNLEAVLKSEAAPGPRPTIYDRDIYTVLDEIQRKIALEGIDVNTALREGQEEAEDLKIEIDQNR
ncbi:extracellular solute-binding protein [Bacillus niameyensis]|uniref:extracellular solute-binding protein n=1 Tax=Bacillus niameyensis TaxID=1522308 RepID=UPI000AB4C0ED|nr:extracellular solute-binding protein [Bacillus niameyensis]